MRLIDADELFATVDADCYNGATIFDALEVIKDSPTIKAIPLSFIREEIERLDKCKLTDTAEYLRNVLKYYDAVERGEETW
jgi:hypothetical protein